MIFQGPFRPCHLQVSNCQDSRSSSMSERTGCSIENRPLHAEPNLPHQACEHHHPWAAQISQISSDKEQYPFNPIPYSRASPTHPNHRVSLCYTSSHSLSYIHRSSSRGAISACDHHNWVGIRFESPNHLGSPKVWVVRRGYAKISV